MHTIMQQAQWLTRNFHFVCGLTVRTCDMTNVSDRTLRDMGLSHHNCAVPPIGPFWAP